MSLHPTSDPAVDRISTSGESDRLVPSKNTGPHEFRRTQWMLLRELLRLGKVTLRREQP